MILRKPHTHNATISFPIAELNIITFFYSGQSLNAHSREKGFSEKFCPLKFAVVLLFL